MYKEKPKSLNWESPYDDDTEEEKMDREVEIWKKHYSSKHRILLVGEGDFSFSLCIARAFGFARNMVATSLDTQGTCICIYTYLILYFFFFFWNYSVWTFWRFDEMGFA